MMNTKTFYTKTPSVTVLDNRGLIVRNIAYCRHPDTPDVTSERITRHQYDACGFLTQNADPRLHDAGLANFVSLNDLTGNTLRTQSVDAGTVVSLNDAAGRPFLGINAAGVTCIFQYEGTELLGRPLSMTEQATDGVARITERYVYAGNSDAEKALNLAGQCVSHYDTAGLVRTDSVSLNDVPLSVTRLLLKDADNPNTVADWQGDDTTAWNELLDSRAYAALTTADASGAVLTTTDAKGNQQRVTCDVAGLLSGSWLTLKGGKEQTIVASLTYSAAGQKLREEHGNGVVTTYSYEPETQRLIGIKTERPAGHKSGQKILQDLRYEYDPVGNVLAVVNDAEATRFWRNQKVMPGNTYVYDSLYQLVSATGREMAGAGSQGSGLPSAAVPIPVDGSACTNYFRTYSYDGGGNLTQIRHAPASGSGYTTNITVSNRSNRGVLSTLTEDAAEVEALFTAAGQQEQLLPGQKLVWTLRNELLKVTPVVRDGSTDDRESYSYDAGSQRILKVNMQKTGSSTRTQRALYLPGVELRSAKAGETETENLQVITVGEAGRAQVRVLHWESGRPAGISNDQLRYSYDSLTGSSGLELDGDGNVISLEEYYPYGGTALWTARSAVEADYKTVRYSGKERDATGLYYYGYRYYQPWAGRWLSADPAGTVDGLNLFRMCRNNPSSLQDPDGTAPLGWLDLPSRKSSSDVTAAIYNNRDTKYGLPTNVGSYYRKFNEKTKNILQTTANNESELNNIKQAIINKPSKASSADAERKAQNLRSKAADKMQFTKAKLKKYAAHAAGYTATSHLANEGSGQGGEEVSTYRDTFLNLEGSLEKKKTFPGVTLINENIRPGFEEYSPEKLKKLSGQGRWRPDKSLGYYVVTDTETFISGIKKQYSTTDYPLHPVVERRIREHISGNNGVLPKMAGIAGLHAEVQALNAILSSSNEGAYFHTLSNSYIFTQRLIGAGEGNPAGADFPACFNCSGILSGLEHVMTGRVEHHSRLRRRKSF